MALPAGATNWDAVGGPGAGRPARVGPARERRTGGSQMRVMLAFDGSAGAEAARDLVAHLRWPTGTAITVVAALERGRDLFGAPDWADGHRAPRVSLDRGGGPCALSGAGGTASECAPHDRGGGRVGERAAGGRDALRLAHLRRPRGAGGCRRRANPPVGCLAGRGLLPRLGGDDRLDG